MTIDIIGKLYEYPQDSEQDSIEMPGWHVNVTPDFMRQEWEHFRVEPSPLRRVWAGDDPLNPTLTVPLRFDSEAQANQLMGL